MPAVGGGSSAPAAERGSPLPVTGRGERRDVRADGLEASACFEGDTLGSGVEGRRCAMGKCLWFYLLCSFDRSPNPANLSFPSLISSSGAVAKDAAPLAPTKALKTGARATPHSAP